MRKGIGRLCMKRTIHISESLSRHISEVFLIFGFPPAGKITVFGVGQRTQDIYNANALNELLDKTVITRTFKEVVGKDIRRIHQVPLRFTPEERAVYEQAMERFYEMRWNYFNSTGNSRKDSSMQLIQQIVLMLRISAAPNTVQEYMGGLPVKIRKVTQMVADWSHEIVAVGVRHKMSCRPMRIPSGKLSRSARCLL